MPSYVQGSGPGDPYVIGLVDTDTPILEPVVSLAALELGVADPPCPLRRRVAAATHRTRSLLRDPPPGGRQVSHGRKAVLTQIRTALIAMLLLRWLKQKTPYRWSLSNLLALQVRLTSAIWTALCSDLLPPNAPYFQICPIESICPLGAGS